MSRRILLLGVNASWSQSNPVLYYLREMLKDLPDKLQLAEFTINDAPEVVIERIIAVQPEVIGISVYIWNRLYLEDLVPRLCVVLPEARWVMGGPEAGALAKHLPATAEHWVIPGAGEAAFRQLTEQDFPLAQALPEPPHIPLRDIPFAYRGSDVERLAGHLVYYECSRGCPFTCAFCLSANDRRMEYRFDPDNACDIKKLHGELDALVRLNPRTVKFVDRSFNLNRALAHAVWEYVAQMDCRCDFHFEIYPRMLDDSDLAVLSRMPAGRIRLETGIQSVHDHHLARIGRESDWALIKPGLQRLRTETRVHIHSDLLIGLPGESIDDIARSVNEVMSTLPDELQLGTLKILPDTPMVEIAHELGYDWDDQPPYQVCRTDVLSEQDMSYLNEIARIINLYWNRQQLRLQTQELFQRWAAFVLFARIHRIHREKGLEFWGISARERAEIINEINEMDTFS